MICYFMFLRAINQLGHSLYWNILDSLNTRSIPFHAAMPERLLCVAGFEIRQTLEIDEFLMKN